MIERDDELTERLRSLDPAAIDPPPAPGTSRYHDLEDTIMANIAPTDVSAAATARATGDLDQPTSRRRRSLLLAAVAAIAVLAATGLALAPGSTPSAVATVRTAAQNNATVQTFRVTFASEDFDFLPGGSATAEVDGNDLHLVADDQELIRIGDTEWFSEGGEFQSSPATETFAPFGEASAQVIAAALASELVTDEGQEVLNGTATTRYRIELDDASRAALSEVPPRAQFWFTAETSESAEVMVDDEGNEVTGPTERSGFLEDADAITIWVADELIHQIEVSTGSNQFVFTFFDFGADITITPPR